MQFSRLCSSADYQADYAVQQTMQFSRLCSSADYAVQADYAIQQTMQFYIKYQFGRDLVQKNVIELKYSSTNEMIADLFTKPIASE